MSCNFGFVIKIDFCYKIHSFTNIFFSMVNFEFICNFKIIIIKNMNFTILFLLDLNLETFKFREINETLKKLFSQMRRVLPIVSSNHVQR